MRRMVTAMELQRYTTATGRCPFDDWYRLLESMARARVTMSLDRLAAGLLAKVKPVGAGVLGFRIDFGSGYRVCFGRDGQDLVILLAGGGNSEISMRQSNIGATTGTRSAIPARIPIKRRAPLTRPFSELVLSSLASDPAFREALWQDVQEAFRTGDLVTGRSMPRGYFPEIDPATLEPTAP